MIHSASPGDAGIGVQSARLACDLRHTPDCTVLPVTRRPAESYPYACLWLESAVCDVGHVIVQVLVSLIIIIIGKLLCVSTGLDEVFGANSAALNAKNRADPNDEVAFQGLHSIACSFQA